ncbi:hypothetical protein CK203_115392 [Vitis vinifera]|uniref:Uncharacterized protein n=1 Tax=Vitis vinifera TaxID=29760 RepID=A0A438FFK1_VITVI|nr:hypothetical protein CK203_115392 [Vitis vinifera]
MKSLGAFGIYRKAYKIILPWRRLFTQIILAYILPLFFISLANTHLSNSLLPKIVDQDKKDLLKLKSPLPTTPTYLIFSRSHPPPIGFSRCIHHLLFHLLPPIHVRHSFTPWPASTPVEK